MKFQTGVSRFQFLVSFSTSKFLIKVSKLGARLNRFHYKKSERLGAKVEQFYVTLHWEMFDFRRMQYKFQLFTLVNIFYLYVQFYVVISSSVIRAGKLRCGLV